MSKKHKRKHLGQFVIGPMSCAVVEVPDLRNADGARLYGEYSPLPSEIRLHPGIDPGKRKAVIVHEAIHAIDDVYCIGLSEKQTHRLATAVTMMVRDNPEWFEKE